MQLFTQITCILTKYFFKQGLFMLKYLNGIMDFKTLMEIASNKKQENKKGAKERKSQKSGKVSNEAVQAFLARKNAEKVKQQELEREAKRARIQARIEQEKLEKLSKMQEGSSGKTSNRQESSRNPSRSEMDVQFSGEKKRFARGAEKRLDDAERAEIMRNLLHGKPREKPTMEPEEQAVITLNNKTQKSKGKQNEIRQIRKRKIGDEFFDRQRRNGQETSRVETRNEQHLSEPKKKKLKRPPPPALSFQQLMDVAKQQADNPDALLKLTLPRQEAKKSEPETDCTEARTKIKPKKNDNKTRDNKPSRSETTDIAQHRNKPMIQAGKGTKPNVALPSNRTPSIGSQKAGPHLRADLCKKMTIERRTISEKSRGGMPEKFARVRHRRGRHGYFSDEEDDLGDFIDDTGGDSEDVSGYIKQIFGYDKNRYRDRDDDIRGMESSFADIQREEAKSSRIAKLEDEIERLKEEKLNLKNANKKLER